MFMSVLKDIFGRRRETPEADEITALLRDTRELLREIRELTRQTSDRVQATQMQVYGAAVVDVTRMLDFELQQNSRYADPRRVPQRVPGLFAES